jgi:hypothetical protein
MVLSFLFATSIVLHGVQYEVRVVRLATDDERLEWCGPRQHIQACTRFAALELTATADEQDGAWRLKTRAHFIAFIGLRDTSRLGHEINHVRDVEDAINGYLLQLSGAAFGDREACERARAEALEGFEARVRAYVEASNLVRDGSPHPER